MLCLGFVRETLKVKPDFDRFSLICFEIKETPFESHFKYRRVLISKLTK